MYKNILVPLDGSELAERGLGEAATLARETGARLTLVRCVPEEDPLLLQAALTHGPCHYEDVREMGRKRAQEYLDGVAERGELKGLIAKTEARTGDAVESILSAAADAKSDLLVVSTHGRSGLGHLMLGSVTEKLLRRAPCPVLVVR